MKIAVKDLEPNPYRKINSYPVDRKKVDALKTSIKEKTFWDNLLVRKRGDKYQLAYGHHRWIALKELGVKEIDVPVRKIDDATMVQIMAEENLNWTSAPAVLIQTVQTAKEFLDAELAKGWKDSAQMFRVLFDSQHAFEQAMRKEGGVGRNTLVKFLGGNWSDRKVETALNILKDKEIDQEAVKTIPSMRQAEIFQKEVKKHEIPKPTQKRIAKQIAKDELGYRQIPDLVAEHSTMPVKKEKPQPKAKPWLDDFVKETCGLMCDLYNSLSKIKGNVKNIQSKRVYETFVRDGKELTELVLEIFKNETEEKKEKGIL